MSKLLIACLVTLTPMMAGADINKCTDRNGTVTYSDQPCPGGKKIEGARKLSRDEELDAKVRYYDEQIKYQKSKINDLKEDIQRDKEANQQHEKDSECAKRRIEYYRRVNEISGKYDTSWWANRAESYRQEYIIDCGQLDPPGRTLRR